MKGVDLSRYQRGLTIQQVRDAGRDFAIIKVTEGVWLKDAAAFDFCREAYETGFPVGCYCYSHAVTAEDARNEARFLLTCINGSPMPCGVFLDMEDAKQLSLAKEKLMEIADAWCGAIRDAGYIPGVYGSEYNIWAKLDPEALAEDCLVWTAHYGREPDMPCDLWQSGDNGHIAGFSGSVDTDEARSARFRRLVEQGYAPARPAAPDISGALALLAGYLRTAAFAQGFLSYIRETEVQK